jgi:multiple sugar transport system substrate-binding protein
LKEHTVKINPRRTSAVATAAAALALTACGGGFDSGSSGTGQQTGTADLKVLVASGGPADLNAVKDAAASWAAKTGSKAEVTAAQEMTQQLSQGFASGNPPDVFMVDASQFPTYAKAGNLEAYGDALAMKDDFYPGLRETFTYQGKFYCAPKDSSTLGLAINTELWAKAGLTDADVPKTWDELAAVAKKLTTGKVTGLGIGDTRDRIGAFMVQSGGWITNPDQSQMTAQSPQNVAALTFVKKMLDDGVAKYPKQLDSGWSGEALGKGKAAMVIEGNWLKGGMKADYPDLKYVVAELPAGPKGKGTLAFTQCWGVAAKSKYKAQAVDFVKSLMTVPQQITFAKAFGVMPSLQSAKSAYQQQFPEDAAWLAGTAYAQGPVNAVGMDPVLKDFDTKLQTLAQSDPKVVLDSLQKNGSAALQQNK